MEKGYFSGNVVPLAELVDLFKSWGMSQGDAARLAIPLTFPHAFNDDGFKNLVDSFRQEHPCTPQSQSAAEYEGRCGSDVEVKRHD